ncbi:MAG: TIGR03790 family protein [Burkholderiales bacterium]|nr:TIGR03790 family protein [Phycisphaerae bacterium]
MLCRRLVWVSILFLLARPAGARLVADQLLLIANKNFPESVELARYYAAARQVPASQILELDLPRGEDLLPDQYQSRLATPVRSYLESRQGSGIQCIVLFYGVPLHVGADISTPADRAELAMLNRAVEELDRRTAGIAQSAEALLKQLGLEPKPHSGVGSGAARVRVETAALQVQEWAQQSNDRVKQQLILDEMVKVQAQIAAVGTDVLTQAAGGTSVGTSPPSAAPRITGGPASTSPAADAPLTPRDARALLAKPRDRHAREQVRNYVAANNGGFILWQILTQQIEWLSSDQSDASVDSELSLVRDVDFPRGMYRENALHLQNAEKRTRQIMVARIDAPLPAIAKRIIDDSIAVEQSGLSGSVVFDCRGLPATTNGKPDAYGWYDELMRTTSKVIAEKTSLHVVTDNQAQVILPKTVKDVALYLGWYSLQNYIPGCSFNRGAVGYHVASLELTHMRNALSKEWVPNMLKDGICATLGAVSEPYLHSFPRPDEFFPILLTGEWTLAETYWMSCPLVSWKIVLIGDPLYRPYAAKPGMNKDVLPAPMRAAIQKIEARAASGR